MGELTSGKKSRKKARKIGLLELTFYVFSRILNLQIHAHIYRSFICHHKMLGIRIAKRQIEPQKPANPCGARLCSCIFFVAKTLKKIWVKMWVNCLTHTVTHIGWQSAALPPTASSCPMGTTKCAERAKEHRKGNCFLSGALRACGTYRICAMKLPIFSAALLCICRVTWV